MTEFDFYLDVLQALEAIGARYMIVGAYGASAYGLNRATHDVDIIVDLDADAGDARPLVSPHLTTMPIPSRCATPFAWASCSTSSTALWV